MQSKIKNLKTVLKVQVVVGFLITVYMMFLVGVMSTDSPTSSYLDVLGGVAITFAMIGVPTVVLPLLALRELGRFEKMKKLSFTYANAIIGLVVGMFSNPLFLLLAIVEFYLVYGIQKAVLVKSVETDEKTN